MNSFENAVGSDSSKPDQSEENNRYQQFTDSRRRFYNELGGSTLDHSKRDFDRSREDLESEAYQENAPFDPIAAKLAEANDMEVAIINGRDPENLEACLRGKKFQGTVIR